MLVIGDVINDVIVIPEAATAIDSDTVAQVTAAPGGSGANQAAWLAALGVPVRLVARVGAADAAYHRGVLSGAGVDARLVEDAEVPTGSIVVIVAGDGTRSMYTDRGANRRLAPVDFDAERLDGVGHVHASGYALIEPGSRDAVAGLWRAAAGSRADDVGRPRFGRLPGRRRAGLFEWTAGVDLIFPNLAEGSILTGADDPDEVMRRLLVSFPIVALKLGERGAMVASRAEPCRSRATHRSGCRSGAAWSTPPAPGTRFAPASSPDGWAGQTWRHVATRRPRRPRARLARWAGGRLVGPCPWRSDHDRGRPATVRCGRRHPHQA